MIRSNCRSSCFHLPPTLEGNSTRIRKRDRSSSNMSQLLAPDLQLPKEVVNESTDEEVSSQVEEDDDDLDSARSVERPFEMMHKSLSLGDDLASSQATKSDTALNFDSSELSSSSSEDEDEDSPEEDKETAKTEKSNVEVSAKQASCPKRGDETQELSALETELRRQRRRKVPGARDLHQSNFSFGEKTPAPQLASQSRHFFS